jgi:hydroxymethylpyrimidine/phosphomethylpyrimidine kinase
MLGDQPTIAAVARALDEIGSDTPVVLDPVMVAESGAALLDRDAHAALVELMLPRVRVVTPNVPEALVLAGSSEAPDRVDPADLARAIHALGCEVVVVTGGHRETATDVFFDGEQLIEIPGPRFPGRAAHGSGCTHSSVLAARLAWGDDPLQAAQTAKAMAARAVRDGLMAIGAGAGPVNVLGLGVEGPRGSASREQAPATHG